MMGIEDDTDWFSEFSRIKITISLILLVIILLWMLIEFQE